MSANAPIYIYGLFDAQGKVAYVGQTERPQTRANAHKNKHGNAYTLQVMFEANSDNCSAVEQFALDYFRRLGQAQLNKAPCYRNRHRNDLTSKELASWRESGFPKSSPVAERLVRAAMASTVQTTTNS